MALCFKRCTDERPDHGGKFVLVLRDGRWGTGYFNLETGQWVTKKNTPMENVAYWCDIEGAVKEVVLYGRTLS